MNTLGFAAFLFAIIGAVSIAILFKLNAAWVILLGKVEEGYGTVEMTKSVTSLSKLHLPLVVVIAWSAVGMITCLVVFFIT